MQIFLSAAVKISPAEQAGQFSFIEKSMENEQEPVRIGNEAICSGYAEARTASELNAVFASYSAFASL